MRDEHPGELGLDVEALRRQVADGNFALRPHAMQHAVKEGFGKEDVAQVILNGVVVETYPERKRCLLYTDVIIEGVKMPLHVVCEHRLPGEPVNVVTAYVPSREEWITPTLRKIRK